jgi:hypothetical protein
MGYLPETTKQRIADIALGIRCERTDLATVVFAAGPVNLFTITGGNVALLMLRFEVEVLALANDAAVPLYSITTAAPYAVATVAFSAAATTIALYGIGAAVTVVGTTLADVPIMGATIGPTLWGAGPDPLILTPGIISVANGGVAMSGAATSVIRHQMWWLPLDDNSSVVAS